MLSVLSGVSVNLVRYSRVSARRELTILGKGEIEQNFSVRNIFF